MNRIIINAIKGKENPNKAHPNLFLFSFSALLTQYIETTMLVSDPRYIRISVTLTFSIKDNE
jgi:hypothetical protein